MAATRARRVRVRRPRRTFILKILRAPRHRLRARHRRRRGVKLRLWVGWLR